MDFTPTLLGVVPEEEIVAGKWTSDPIPVTRPQGGIIAAYQGEKKCRRGPKIS